MRLVTSTALVVGALVAMAPTGASAAVVCNEDGDCWRTTHTYEYRPEYKVRVYEDDWKWDEADNDKYRWRESRGRGYYNDGVWIEF